jgi:hypothetical protein
MFCFPLHFPLKRSQSNNAWFEFFLGFLNRQKVILSLQIVIRCFWLAITFSFLHIFFCLYPFDAEKYLFPAGLITNLWSSLPLSLLFSFSPHLTDVRRSSEHSSGYDSYMYAMFYDWPHHIMFILGYISYPSSIIHYFPYLSLIGSLTCYRIDQAWCILNCLHNLGILNIYLLPRIIVPITVIYATTFEPL